MKLILFLLVSSLALAHTVELDWSPVPPGCIRQAIWRQIGCQGTFVRRAQALPAVETWIDNAAVNGKTYCYYIEFVFADGVKSQFSTTASATIPAS